MNKKLPIIILVLVLLAGAAIFFTSQKNKPEVSVKTAENQVKRAIGKSANEPIEATLKSLVSMGKTLKCSFSSKEKDNPINGVVYVGKGKIREDFTTTISDKTPTNGHLIIDKTNMYMWTDDTKQGIRMSLDQIPTPNPSGESNGSQAPDMNKSMNFNCENWTLSDAMFSLPPQVNFQSFDIPQIPATTGTTDNVEMKQSACSACDNIPAGEAQNACRKQLNCQ